MKEETKNEKGRKKTDERRKKIFEERLTGDFAKEVQKWRTMFANRKKQ